jgi:hypothetical protein
MHWRRGTPLTLIWTRSIGRLQLLRSKSPVRRCMPACRDYRPCGLFSLYRLTHKNQSVFQVFVLLSEISCVASGLIRFDSLVFSSFEVIDIWSPQSDFELTSPSRIAYSQDFAVRSLVLVLVACSRRCGFGVTKMT